MTGHRALEKKQITQGNNRKVQNPSESLKEGTQQSPFLFFIISPKTANFTQVLCIFAGDFKY